jgi:hypothetical protein
MYEHLHARTYINARTCFSGMTLLHKMSFVSARKPSLVSTSQYHLNDIKNEVFFVSAVVSRYQKIIIGIG